MGCIPPVPNSSVQVVPPACSRLAWRALPVVRRPECSRAGPLLHLHTPELEGPSRFPSQCFSVPVAQLSDLPNALVPPAVSKRDSEHLSLHLPLSDAQSLLIARPESQHLTPVEYGRRNAALKQSSPGLHWKKAGREEMG